MTRGDKGLEITEEQFASQVEGLLNLFCWRWCHSRPARTEKGWRTALSGYQGFPDYIATRGDKLLFAELKSEKGKVSPAQQEWLEALAATGAAVYIWRPLDFLSIKELLK